MNQLENWTQIISITKFIHGEWVWKLEVGQAVSVGFQRELFKTWAGSGPVVTTQIWINSRIEWNIIWINLLYSWGVGVQAGGWASGKCWTSTRTI
jgi:hypothetical protein